MSFHGKHRLWKRFTKYYLSFLSITKPVTNCRRGCRPIFANVPESPHEIVKLQFSAMKSWNSLVMLNFYTKAHTTTELETKIDLKSFCIFRYMFQYITMNMVGRGRSVETVAIWVRMTLSAKYN